MNSKKKIGDIVSIEVTEENYQEALNKGIAPDEMLPVGKHYGARWLCFTQANLCSEWEQVRGGEIVVSIRPGRCTFKLAPDVSEAFPADEVNEALRQIFVRRKRLDGRKYYRFNFV